MLLRELVQSAVLQDPNCFLKYLQRPGWLLVHVGDADMCRSYSPRGDCTNFFFDISWWTVFSASDAKAAWNHPPTSTHIRQGLAAPRFVNEWGQLVSDLGKQRSGSLSSFRCLMKAKDELSNTSYDWVSDHHFSCMNGTWIELCRSLQYANSWQADVEKCIYIYLYTVHPPIVSNSGSPYMGGLCQPSTRISFESHKTPWHV